MQFNNREFEANAKTSLSTLQKLKESLNFGSLVSGATKSLSSIGGALTKLGMKTPFAPMIKTAQAGFGTLGNVISKFGMRNPFASSTQGVSDLAKGAVMAGGPAGMGALEGGVTAVSSKFIALSTIAITALSNITNKAISSGTAFLKSFTVAPIMDGLREYELNLKSIQVVQANTDRPLPEINGALEELNKYSDQTIYNFAEMAKNVGTFTAAGVDLETSVSSIKGIANMAALSGSNSQQAATAMYQLSQAISSGKVGLMDWNSVVNAGMGGKKLQGALAQTAIAMGEIDKAQVKGTASGEKLTIAGQSFRESIMAQPGQESWLSSDILVNSLAALDGRYSFAALSQEKLANGTRKYANDAAVLAQIEKNRNEAAKKGIKYTDEQFEALQKLSTSAYDSATKVKTLGQVFEIAKETIGSGWSGSFKSIFGNLNQAKTLFTEMSGGLGKILEQNARVRNNMLAKWNEKGGRTAVIDGLKAAWESVWSIMQAVGSGFRDIFPRNSAKDVISMSESFRDFMQSLIPGEKTLDRIRDISGGVFAVFGIGKQILGGLVTMFQTMFSTVGGGEGHFLNFGAGIGNALKWLNDFLEKSGLLTAIFEGIGKVLSLPVALLQGFAGLLSTLFDGLDEGKAGAVGESVDKVTERLSSLQVVGERIRAFFVKLGGYFDGFGQKIVDAFMGIGDMVAGAFTSDNFGTALDVVNTGLLAGIIVLIKNFFSKDFSFDLTGGLFDGIKETLGEATSAFQNMQNNLKAEILLKIAAAIGVMALALLVLSGIDPKALTKALAAMGGGFGILITAMMVLMKYLGPAGLAQMYIVTSGMTKMAVSILLVSFALKTLSGIKFSDMLRGLAGLAGVMFILTKAMVPLAANSKGMSKAATSMILLGIAMNILAVAVKIFATMSWEELARGLLGMAGALLVIAAGMKLMPNLEGTALQLMGLGIAMNLLGVAMKIFASMSWEEMAKGILMLGGALVVIAAAMTLMPKGMLLQSVALVAVAGAMVILSGALKAMGTMSWDEIGRGLAVLGGALILLAVGLQAIGIVGTIGAIGLLAAVAALTVLVPILVSLGAMSWEMIIKSMTALAAVFVILGLAAYFLGPLTPVILGLGAAMLLLGAGLALAGVGALAAAMAFGILVAAGSAGIAVFMTLIRALISAIPAGMTAVAKGLVGMAVEIAKGAPKIAKAFGKVLGNILDQIANNIPKMGRVMLAFINTAINVVVKAVPKIATAGLRLIIGFLEIIARHVPRMVDLAVDIVTSFINSLARNLPKIIQSGVNLILAFMRGVAKAIRENGGEFGEAGADIGLAIIEGTVKGIKGGASKIKDAAVDAAKEAWDGVKNFLGINSPSRLFRDSIGRQIPAGMAVGVDDEAPVLVESVKALGRTALDTLSATMSNLSNEVNLDPSMTPTITPVLDLSEMTREAAKMSGILAIPTITPTMSYRTAADISAITQAADEQAAQDAAEAQGAGDIYQHYEQHLHSPTPIDSVTVYRGSKSLFSLTKEGLTR